MRAAERILPFQFSSPQDSQFLIFEYSASDGAKCEGNDWGT
jgi:hypothetical protein